MKNKFAKINKIVQSQKYLENKDIVLGFIRNSELRYYFLDKLPKKFENLEEIDFILKKLLGDEKPFALFHILENSISVKNNAYILSFISKHYEDFAESFTGQRVDRMFQESALRIVKKIVKSGASQIDNILEFLTELLKKRKYSAHKLFDRKDNIEREKGLVGEILLEISKKKGIDEELLALIKNNFDLISDYGRFSHTAPAPVFGILKEYIVKSKDFEKAFKEIVRIILDQHVQSDSYKGRDGKNKFEGHEWGGGGISQAGNAFSISDRHFVDYILRPVLDDYYKKEPGKAFEFVNSFCIWRNGKNAIASTKEHPDFLLRASIGILLKEHKSENKKVGNILAEFLKSTKGIPSKVTLIFQEVHKKDYGLSKKQKWELVKKQLDIKMYEGLPANVFVLKVIINLVKENYPPAVDLFFKLLKNSKLYKSIWHAETTIIEMIGVMLDSNPIKGLEGFKNYIETDFFKNGLGTFDAYPVSHLLNNILNNSYLYKEGLKLLEALSNQKDPLTSNQQILICNGLINAKGNSDSENIEVLMKIYNDFLWPLLSEGLKKDLKRDYKNEDYGLIYNKFSFSYAREKFVQFAERLARKNKIAEALSIIEIFVNDPDPFSPVSISPHDPKGEYDAHKKILEGKDVAMIDTVRGWCGWALLQCSALAARPYIKKVIFLTKKLIEDENLYVATYGANALSGLARNRLTVLPEDRSTLFFGKDTENALRNAREVDNIAFNFLKRVEGLGKKSQDAMSDALLHVFDYMRGLSQSDAKTLIDSLSKMSDKTISEAAVLFIYFAEFRKDHLKDWKWKMKGLYDDLGTFNAESFQRILEDIIKRGNSEINSSFAWRFWKLIAESTNNKTETEGVLTYNRAFSIAYKYLSIISNYYDNLAFSHIYRFVEENLERKPKRCYELFVKSLKIEKQMLEEKAKVEKPNFYDWYPHYRTGDVLIKIKENIGINEMLEAIELLLGYPTEVIARISGEVPNVIKDLPAEYNENDRIEKIFDKLIKTDPRYYDVKQTWEKKIK